MPKKTKHAHLQDKIKKIKNSMKYTVLFSLIGAILVGGSAIINKNDSSIRIWFAGIGMPLLICSFYSYVYFYKQYKKAMNEWGQATL